MKKSKEEIKNIGVYAHVDAGKTTLTEQLLYSAGAIRHLGKVDNGNTVTDSLELERERGISIISMPTSYNHKGQKINIIDTPGHVDFIAEVERSMLVLDGAILVISAKEGVQSHTKLLFNALQRMEVPTLIFVNKVDRVGVDIKKVIAEIQEHLTPNIFITQDVVEEGSKQASIKNRKLQLEDSLIEILSETDETIMMDYLEGVELLSDRLHNTLKVAVEERKIYPVMFGSALNSIGMNEILDNISDLLPFFKPLNTEEASGVVFKVFYKSKKIGRTSMIKLTAGQVRLYDYIGKDKVTSVSRWNHGQLEDTTLLQAGDVAMVSGLNNLKVGETFGYATPNKRIVLGKPTLKVNAKANSPSQRVELLEALSAMAESDPYLSYELNEFSDSININLFGYVQMEIVKENLKREYGLDIQMADPTTIFMETPKKEVEVMIAMYEDDLPFHAGIALKIEPLPQGSGVQYSTRLDLNTGSLRNSFQKAIKDGIYAYLDQGLHGWELTDMKITLVDFERHPVNSTPKDFRNMAPLVFFEALKKAETKLLWPMNEYRMTIPALFMNKAFSDLQRMKATIKEPLIKGEKCMLTGTIPVELCQNYELDVHAYSGGMGVFEGNFTGYEEALEQTNKERERFKIDPANRGKYLLDKLKL